MITTSMKRILLAPILIVLFAYSASHAEDQKLATEFYGGREMLVYVPQRLPAMGQRALVVVLHGGLGNAKHIASERAEAGMNMDIVATKYGFVVAYLNGTKAMRYFARNMLAWNAGECCGQPAENNIDDVGYIKNTVAYLVSKYGIDPARVYGVGHSNGAMMTQRVMCETGLYAAAVPISSPLEIQTSACPAARGKRILAIHGAEDENVPVNGGRGSKGISHVDFNSEDYSRRVFLGSGASYTLKVVAGADHHVDRINETLEQSEGSSIAELTARFFGLTEALSTSLHSGRP